VVVVELARAAAVGDAGVGGKRFRDNTRVPHWGKPPWALGGI
jgi:hypothetical protein